ncbi:MAG: GPW/gp25 family protein [Cyanobacteria bacterium CRU_2_1]|nr:GPW/gp25 family protein [Oscillatoriales cyanobacterium RU_3_3]NJR24923.1 GPW/gp25 family protein [Richelia sp. CSU_2_1]NJR64015.1 GPW/gp25 family protein [Cyanobacteria bacterium CRU_2_1]
MIRQDYTFPFSIDAASHQAAQSRYEAHVEQMIRQVLLTSPGERVNLPEFGCGLRQLLFAPHSEALDATTKLIVLQALNRWLVGQIQVKDVKVGSIEETGDPAQLRVQIEYVLIETMANKRMEVRIL